MGMQAALQNDSVHVFGRLAIAKLGDAQRCSEEEGLIGFKLKNVQVQILNLNLQEKLESCVRFSAPTSRSKLAEIRSKFIQTNCNSLLIRRP